MIYSFTGTRKGATRAQKGKLIGTNGNVFALIGKASQALRKAGMQGKACELQDKTMAAGSYDKALQIIMQYVEVY